MLRRDRRSGLKFLDKHSVRRENRAVFRKCWASNILVSVLRYARVSDWDRGETRHGN